MWVIPRLGGSVNSMKSPDAPVPSVIVSLLVATSGIGRYCS